MRLPALGLVIALSPLGAGAAAAQGPAPAFGEEPVVLDLGLGTAFPVHVGAQVTLELPYRIQAQLEVGLMPRGYLDAINAFCVGVGCYDQLTADLISAAFGNALVLRMGLGMRPFPEEGFEVGAGYTLAVLGGGISAPETIETVTGMTVDRRGGNEVPLAATMQGFQISLGWRFILYEWLLLRVQLSYFHVFASETWITRDPVRPGGMGVQNLSRALDAYLEPYVTTYVKAPVLTVVLAARID